MKIVVDLIHPANIHYFKHFIKAFEEKNHEVLVTARRKDVLHLLLKNYDIDFIDSGLGRIGKGAFGKMIYLFFTAIRYYFLYRKFKPSIVLSFGSIPCALASYFLKIPHISFEDTEHAKLNRSIYSKFTDFIFTPKCFYDNISVDHFEFDGYMELFYLHENRFTPREDVLKELNRSASNKYIFVRFVSWEAFHDIGQKGLNTKDKISLIRKLGESFDVFISSEGTVPQELKEKVIAVSPEKIHDILNYSSLYIGEGGTMASEAVLLGVPAIYINSLPLMGYLKEEQNAGLLYHLHDTNDIYKKSIELLEQDKQFFKNKRDIFLKDKIDPTSLLVWFIENYPKSKVILNREPSFQYKFK